MKKMTLLSLATLSAIMLTGNDRCKPIIEDDATSQKPLYCVYQNQGHSGEGCPDELKKAEYICQRCEVNTQQCPVRISLRINDDCRVKVQRMNSNCTSCPTKSFIR